MFLLPYLLLAYQLDHLPAKGVTDKHIGFGISIIVIALVNRRLLDASLKILGIHSRYIAGEVRIFNRITYGLLIFQDL